MYGGQGHGGIYGGSMFIGSKTTMTNYHPSYMIAQHTPVSFGYTSAGNLYVEKIGEFGNIYCKNPLTAMSNIQMNATDITNVNAIQFNLTSASAHSHSEGQIH